MKQKMAKIINVKKHPNEEPRELYPLIYIYGFYLKKSNLF